MLDLPLADPGQPRTSSPARFLGWLARGQARTLGIGATFGIIWMGSQALIPLALGAAIGRIIARDTRGILFFSLVVLGLGLLQAVAGILRHRQAVASFLISASRVQQLLTRRATELGGDLAARVATGEVANLGASDVERVGDALDVVARFCGGVVSYVLIALILLVASPPLGAIVVLGVPVAVLAVAPILRPFERRQTAERDRRTAASSVAADTVSGLRILRGLGGERVFAARYDRASDDVAAASMRTANLQAVLDGAQVVLPGAIVVAVTWVGAHLTVQGTLSPGELVAFYASAAFLVIPMQTFVEAAGKWTAAVVASRRIIAVLTMERSISLSADSVPPGGAPTGPILDERTGVVVESGRLTAIVPATPEEGSALLERLGRWVAPTSPDAGKVSWGGKPVDEIPLAWYREHVTLLERSPFHLRGRLGESVMPERDAQDAAQAFEIVESLPDGADTELPENWRSLSGGQRQRLGLAQVLELGTEVLLLDDPTSAVDAHTEAAIADGLSSLRKGRTTVIVTTSPLVAERADSVVLLAGVALAQGTHQELMSEDPRYEAVVLRGESLS